MTTAFALLLDRCGLSHREAAEFLGTRLDTVKSWSSGRNPAPAGALEELRALYARIDRAAAEALKEIRRARPRPDRIELGLASDDHEARTLGWPCGGAHGAVLGLVVALSGTAISIVPRGSTVATAAAIEAREKSAPGT